MKNEQSIAVLLFTGALVCLVGSHKLEVSLAHADLVSPVNIDRIAYDWQALDQRLKTLDADRSPQITSQGIQPTPELQLADKTPHTAPQPTSVPIARPSILPQPTSVPVVQQPNKPESVQLVRVLDDRVTSVPTRAEMEAYVEQKFGRHAARAKKVIACESGWNPSAVNRSNRDGTDDMGAWQVNSVHGLSDSCRLDFRCSTDFAYKLFKRSGWQPWYSSRRCHGLK